MHLSDLKQQSIKDLAQLAAEHDIEDASAMRRQELIFALLQSQADRGGPIQAEGVLEILQDGFGFLRAPDHNYLPGADDIYVSPSQIRRFNLRTGDTVAGIVRPPKESERYFALLRVEEVNSAEPDPPRAKILFDNLTPLYPSVPFELQRGDGTDATRILAALCPMGKGQRCLVVAPPRTGKTALVLEMIHAIEANHPEVVVIVLLIDERPEAVTEMRDAVSAEVISSTFDEPPTRHVQVAEIVLEKAKRMAESGTDVVVMLDSLTQLVRAHDALVAQPGRLLGGAVDASAMYKPKRFFGAARDLDEAGSLTIIATALTDTGSRTDDVILEELAGTANCELHLDGALPAPRIDLHRSGTMQDARLFSDQELSRARALRDTLRPLDAAEALTRALAETKPV